MNTIRRTKVLIVGGSRGLGFSLAAGFRRRGYEVVILSRTAPSDQIDAEIILENAARPNIAEHCLRQIEPNLLIVNFAEGIYRQPELLIEPEIERAIETNAAGAIRWISAAIRRLPAKAKIGWVSSLTALIPHENWAVYAAAKAAVNHFVEGVRPAARRRGISITVCYPGCLQTDFHRAAGTTAPPDAVSPDAIVGAMSDAIETGQEVWAAQMDAVIVNQYDEMKKRYFAQAKGELR